MRKDFGQNDGAPKKQGGGSDEWAIGTRFTGVKPDEGKLRHVPKLKSRNPSQVIKSLQSDINVEARTINQEVICVLSQFNS